MTEIATVSDGASGTFFDANNGAFSSLGLGTSYPLATVSMSIVIRVS
jgi:hypothetical protein